MCTDENPVKENMKLLDYRPSKNKISGQIPPVLAGRFNKRDYNLLTLTDLNECANKLYRQTSRYDRRVTHSGSY